ncbi:MAG: TlpA family protein disulfide reductase [Bacteroidetes bacterium]|nr:MAG: TlpA family protein disulfide reductase [Bacteroidota bacterium]
MQLAESQQQQFSQLVNQYRLAQRQGSDTGEILTAMARLDAAKVALLDSLKTANPFIAKTLALRTYLGYQSQPELAKIYSSEAEYFAKAYFRFVDFSDPAYNHIPDIHQAFRTYTYTLTRLGLSSQSQLQYIQDILAQIPAGSKAHKMALLGATAGLKGNNDDAYVQLAQAFIDQYGGEQGTVAAQLHQDVQSLRAQLVGGQAPEIHLPTPEGDSLRLSDLRGKVVLIDFWASWCGPCRRENPHVVRLYNKYKDKGFEILGVSLDRNKQSWVKAIEKDGLSWKHVSDLKYWQSEAARTYGVNAIPHTVLVDAEGKIIGKKLRGQALENKLAEIFGQ